jgi:hypothetical protein
MAEVVDLYHFLFSSFEHLNYVFKTGEQKVIQDNDSCQINIKIISQAFVYRIILFLLCQ